MKAYRLCSEDVAREIAASLKEWSPGKASRGAVTKRNDETLSEAAASQIVTLVQASPITHAHFVQQMTPPKFNRYRDGGEYAIHSDASVMHGIRTDLACTVFLSDGYEGGELCVNGHEVKLPPGNAIVYECWRPHYVKPVTSGERIAAIFWLECYIRSEDQRDLLNMLHSVIADEKDETKYAKLGAVHEKLVKMWWA